MLATGDWVTPRLNGVNYFEKPPLVYWLIATSEKVFGLNEWAVRAVPALFALGGVLLTYGATRRLYGRNAALAAGVIPPPRCFSSPWRASSCSTWPCRC